MITKREKTSENTIDVGECSHYVLTNQLEHIMPSLWKRDKSPYWVCCYTSADGQRLKKSTKQTDRKRAWEVCLSIERAERFAKNGTLTEQAAKKIIGEIVERTTGEPLRHYTTADWFSEWQAGKAQTKSAATALQAGCAGVS